MIWAVIAVVIGGAAVAIQAPINGALGRELGAIVPAAAVSFGVGFLVLLAVAVVTGQAGAFVKLGAVPPWLLVGGVLGAVYVMSAIYGVASLGVVTLVAALIFGQMAAAMVIDATGILGVPMREISLQRVAAAGLVAAGLVLSRL